jgi:hypothetical protein
MEFGPHHGGDSGGVVETVAEKVRHFGDRRGGIGYEIGVAHFDPCKAINCLESFAEFGAVFFLYFGQVGGFVLGGLALALEHGEL